MMLNFIECFRYELFNAFLTKGHKTSVKNSTKLCRFLQKESAIFAKLSPKNDQAKMADFDEKCHDPKFHRIFSIRAIQCVSNGGSQDWSYQFN